jgi:fused signal recognition particle receptor
MGFFSGIRRFFAKDAPPPPRTETSPSSSVGGDAWRDELTVRLRAAEPRLSAWLDTALEGVDRADELFRERLRFLLTALECPAAEVEEFVRKFADWLERMEYAHLEEFRSELQYRLALALDLEDEEDERNRLFQKLSEGLSRARERFSLGLDAVFSSHGAPDDAFWESMEELFIASDVGFASAGELVERLKKRARDAGVSRTEDVRALLRAEFREVFRAPRRITAVNAPEVVLMIGVNGAGKTTTIAKLAYRERMRGRRVLIAAADTFRAAAVEQLGIWAQRADAELYAKEGGADPAAVAFEALDKAIAGGVDVLFVDTAGRLQTKVDLMEELKKIRRVLAKKHPGAPHRSVLVIDAASGQNALSQAKLFKENAGADEIILSKLDGTAKGGIAVAVAMNFGLPVTYAGLGEKLEDLRPFSGEDFADALLGKEAAGK